MDADDFRHILVLMAGGTILAFLLLNGKTTDTIVGKVNGIFAWAMKNALGN